MTTGEWPDKRARLIHEAAVLTHHATTLADRYPDTIWPATGGVAGSERDVHAAQAAFVAGIRFACHQLHIAVAEINEQIDALDHPTEGTPA